MSGEQEPRRSVRATKGQHTKAFEALENGPQPTKRRQSTKKVTKKAAAAAPVQQEEEDEEVIRCVCGASSQENDDPNEPWIACEKCGVWQHNVCMGMSIFDDDLPKEYFCEQCKPEDHPELLAGMEKGERPWETRRQKHEDENKKKKGKKGKAKRVSDPLKDRSSPATSTGKAKASPAPEPKKEESESKGKRKARDQSQGPQNGKIKLRKVSETQAVPAPSPPTPVPAPTTASASVSAQASPSSAAPAPAAAQAVPEYSPPADLATGIDKLDNSTRKGAAQGLRKSLDAALDQAVKDKLFTIPKSTTKKALAERHALEIERAVHDSHPVTAAATQQCRTLMFNLKKNVELAARVFNRTLSPPELAVMTTDQMATKELQRETAEMKKKAEKQSILINEEGPRVRRTHKGEELIETDNFTSTPEEAPSQLHSHALREAASEAAKSTGHGAASELPSQAGGSGPMEIDIQVSQQHSPQQSNFDIDKVFSSVSSPTVSHQRRPSQAAPSAGPGHDPEVDRLLRDDGNESPPYSPTENIDPDVVWQGQLIMTSIADVTVVAKYAGGADLSKCRGIPWADLIPVTLTVAGRIPEEKAVPYLCSLRYNNQIDLVITSLSPASGASAEAKTAFKSVIDYFQSKKRYGVVGERRLGNVRDTYLIPVEAGDGPIPEPIQNLEDHLIPPTRAEPMLLMVFICRDEAIERRRTDPETATPTPTQAPTPGPEQRQQSNAGAPTWSPATPQGSFSQPGFPPSSTAQQSVTPTPQHPLVAQQAPQQAPPPQQTHAPVPHQSHTPIPPPVIPGQPIPSQVQRQTPILPPHSTPAAQPNPSAQAEEALRRARQEGEMKAREVLGPYFNSPIVAFLLPHAARMRDGEWGAVRKCLELEPKARDNLPLLSQLLAEEGRRGEQARQQQKQQQGEPQQHQQLQQQPKLLPPQAGTPASHPGVIQNTLTAATGNLPPPGPR